MNDEGDFSVDLAKDYITKHSSALHSFSDCFRYGTKKTNNETDFRNN